MNIKIRKGSLVQAIRDYPVYDIDYDVTGLLAVKNQKYIVVDYSSVGDAKIIGESALVGWLTKGCFKIVRY